MLTLIPSRALLFRYDTITNSRKSIKWLVLDFTTIVTTVTISHPHGVFSKYSTMMMIKKKRENDAEYGKMETKGSQKQKIMSNSIILFLAFSFRPKWLEKLFCVRDFNCTIFFLLSHRHGLSFSIMSGEEHSRMVIVTVEEQNWSTEPLDTTSGKARVILNMTNSIKWRLPREHKRKRKTRTWTRGHLNKNTIYRRHFESIALFILFTNISGS